MSDLFERAADKTITPSDEDALLLFEQIQNDPEKIEWETLAFHRPFASRRKRLLQKNAFYCSAPMFLVVFMVSGFDFIATVTEPMTWILVGVGILMGYYYSGLTVFSLNRHHYILSQHGLITEEHTHSPKTATKVAKKMIGVLAVLTIVAVLMIGPVALIGASGLGITWLVLANVNFEKFGLMRQVGSLDEIALIRIHNDSDEPRNYIRLFMKTWAIHEGDLKENKFSHYGIYRVDMFCDQMPKEEFIDYIHRFSQSKDIQLEVVDLFSHESKRIPNIEG